MGFTARQMIASVQCCTWEVTPQHASQHSNQYGDSVSDSAMMVCIMLCKYGGKPLSLQIGGKSAGFSSQISASVRMQISHYLTTDADVRWRFKWNTRQSLTFVFLFIHVAVSCHFIIIILNGLHSGYYNADRNPYEYNFCFNLLSFCLYYWITNAIAIWQTLSETVYDASLYFGSFSISGDRSSLAQTSICKMAIENPNQSAEMLWVVYF